MESLLEKKPSLNDCRAAVREAEEAHRNLTQRFESLGRQVKLLEDGVLKLDGERSDCISGIARGSRNDADLSRVRKSLDKERCDLQDTREILDVVKQSLRQAEADLVEKRSALKREEERFWRGVIGALKERYGPEVQKLFSMMNVAIISSGPGLGCPVFNSLGAAFDLKPPRLDLSDGQAEFRRVREELEREFGFFES